MSRQARRIALAGVAAVVMTVPLVGSASAVGSVSASYDRHEVARTQVTVRATPGHLAIARRDVLHAGGQVLRWQPAVNGFVAQVPVTALDGLRSAPGIASINVLGALIHV
jgi:hypothetical protein